MSRPVLEVADIFRAAGDRFLDRNPSQVAWPHLKVMRAIQRCRTAALGGHRDRCSGCGRELGLSYNSCRNRHCPKCQAQARQQWTERRIADLVPLGYFHVVFTVPHALSALMLQNKRLLYSLLFRLSAETMMEVAGNPKHLGAEIGFLGVLHTWGQTLEHHPHIHYVVPEGGFSSDRSAWIRPKYRFFLPVRVLSRLFRGKFVDALKHLYRRGQLQFHGALKPLRQPRAFAQFLRTLYRQEWVVYAKKPFGGPEHVLQYLSRYTHRVAISNYRLLSFEQGKVAFRWKDYSLPIEC
jgi:Putative transposase/Transposase zinc-binding domain